MGSSNAPGTGITVIRSSTTPAAASASSVEASSRSVISPLKRETTTPTVRSAPDGDPSRTATPSGMSSSPGTWLVAGTSGSGSSSTGGSGTAGVVVGATAAGGGSTA